MPTTAVPAAVVFTAFTTLCCSIVSLPAARARTAEPPAEPGVLSTTVGPVDVALFIPEGAAVLRGLYVHAAHYRMSPRDRWAESARGMDFGHIALNIDLKQNNRPKKLRAALDEALAEFAAATGRKELLEVPLIGVGHSAGGMVTPVLLYSPQRALTTCVSCGWITDPDKLTAEQLSVPMLFTLGAIPDAFKMLPGIESRFVPARKRGLCWGLALQWGCAHDFANSATLFIPWCESLARMRLPRQSSPGRPVELRRLRPEDGWLGDRSTIESNWATIAPYGEYPGDKTQAVWLPDRAVAYLWRAFESKDPPVVLDAQSADGAAGLPRPDPKAERGMIVQPGQAIELCAVVAAGAEAEKIAFFDMDRVIGRGEGPNWRFRWESPAPGTHAIFAMWESSGGGKGVSNPALVIVRHRRR